MRIIAGSLKGRIIEDPRGHRTHPMSEKIRGALFNTLGDIEGLTLLDAFTGTGAVAIEAVSRGAASVIGIDTDLAAYKNASQNVASLSVKNVRIIQANVSSWCDHNPDAVFDIVVADPPYDDVKPWLLQKLTDHIQTGGIYIVSLPDSQDLPVFASCELLADKHYGDAMLLFYRKIN